MFSKEQMRSHAWRRVFVANQDGPKRHFCTEQGSALDPSGSRHKYQRFIPKNRSPVCSTGQVQRGCQAPGRLGKLNLVIGNPKQILHAVELAKSTARSKEATLTRDLIEKIQQYGEVVHSAKQPNPRVLMARRVKRALGL